MKLYRASGNPIDKDAKEALKTESRAKFDQLELEHGEFSSEKAEIFQTELQVIEDKYMEKYPKFIEIELKDVPDMIKEYGCAIAVSILVNADGTEEVASFIMDMEH